ncbi:hypothetical protein [Candidatus Methanocrinis natronophilus]|uniref:Uncharacterized protein n=1 Tax=Candidatus Methanocrinis natronophilus TaxID=3033396 RepID=A0ABT5X803_9EURY|nr:hypothetical protein [Candidatus Methanocrinis natronophilus]MDF0590829.1 hypothetical protein [Candidatus Methanocrinis natronophilus]
MLGYLRKAADTQTDPMLRSIKTDWSFSDELSLRSFMIRSLLGRQPLRKIVTLGKIIAFW